MLEMPFPPGVLFTPGMLFAPGVTLRVIGADGVATTGLGLVPEGIGGVVVAERGIDDVSKVSMPKESVPETTTVAALNTFAISG